MMGVILMSEKLIKIVKIIDEYSVVINAGFDHGVKKGQLFEIYVPGESIIDPDSNEDLGTMDFIKGQVVVKKAFPKMSICENSRTENAFTNFDNLASYMLARAKPLNVDSVEISGGFEDYDPKIKVGDLIKRID